MCQITKTKNLDRFGLTAPNEEDGTSFEMQANPFYVTKDGKIVYQVMFSTPDVLVPGDDDGETFELTVNVELSAELTKEQLSLVPTWSKLEYTREDLGRLYRKDPKAYQQGPGLQQAKTQRYFLREEFLAELESEIAEAEQALLRK